MPFIICPRCHQATDFAEPVGDFSTTHLLCERCAEEFAVEIKEELKGTRGEDSKEPKA